MLIRALLLLILLGNYCMAQTGGRAGKVERPKLVVGVVVDQMRWDFLYRYYDRYAPEGGFKRLIDKGFSCENTFINYLPTYTACGHTTLYTGAVPAIHGITGNDWYERLKRKEVYCTEDGTVQGVGTTGAAGKMSPRNMNVTTVCDELRLATNFRSKVIGIAFKDRGGILPAGHSANAAYWYEPASGNFISSTYYMNELPKWVNDFNAKKLPDSYLKQGWKTLYPLNTYVQSTEDEQSYEVKPFGAEKKRFPYDLQEFVGKNYGMLTYTPFGSTVTKEMAIAAVNAEQLGADTITDFLAVSFSTPDYVGHSFGPNSVEAEDTYLRLDKDLGELFNFLDRKIGKDQYLVFLSADHGAAHVARFSQQHKLPGGAIPGDVLEKKLDSVLSKQFGNHKFIEASANSQFFLDHHLIDSLKTNEKAIKATIIDFLSKQEGIDRAFDLTDATNVPLPEQVKKRVVNGYYPSRTGDIQFFFKPGWMSGSGNGTTHGSWNPYDSHIPLVWYGWKVKPGKLYRETYMTDVAATIAAMLKIQMPSGCIGTVIDEAFK
jgi:predicted AlkP superfamily pyrophosphatase or phosphodiesterase